MTGRLQTRPPSRAVLALPDETVMTYYRRITIGLLNCHRGSARHMRALFAVNIDLNRIDSGKQLSNLHNPIAPIRKKITSFVEVTEGKKKKKKRLGKYIIFPTDLCRLSEHTFLHRTVCSSVNSV